MRKSLTPMPTLVVLDNTVLSNFALTTHVDWLRIYPVPVATTRQAWDELERGIRAGRIPPQNWEWLTILELDEQDQRRYTDLKPPLGAGEATCLAAAWIRNCQVATDDKRARQKARDLGILSQELWGFLSNWSRADKYPYQKPIEHSAK